MSKPANKWADIGDLLDQIDRSLDQMSVSQTDQVHAAMRDHLIDTYGIDPHNPDELYAILVGVGLMTATIRDYIEASGAPDVIAGMLRSQLALWTARTMQAVEVVAREVRP